MKTYTIKNELNVADVVKMFNDWGRGANFTYEGIEALLDMLEMCYTDEQGAIDLDIIGLCCDFTESTPSELLSDFSYVDDLSQDLDDDENLEIVMDYLSNNTTVWELENGNVLYANF